MKIKVFLQSINKLKIISLHIKKHTLNTVLKITETIQSTFQTFRGTLISHVGLLPFFFMHHFITFEMKNKDELELK